MSQGGPPLNSRGLVPRIFAVAFAVCVLAAAAGLALAWQLFIGVSDPRAVDPLLIGVAVSSGLLALGLIGIGYSALRTHRQWTRHLADADEALRQAHEEREHRVQQRTADLQALNAKLQSSAEALANEIEERKRGQAALTESRQITDTVLKTVGARIFWKDKNLVYLGCNDLFAHDAGFANPEEVVGKDDYQMVWREQADLYRADDRHVIDSGRSKLLIEEPQTTPDGKHIVLLTNKVPLHDRDGQVIGVLGTYMDITERKRLEETLRESDAKFHSLAEVAQDGLVMIDAEGAIIYWNPAAERIFGYSAAEANGHQIHDWLAPQRYRASAAAGMAEFAKSGRGLVVGKTLQFEALRKDGVEIQIELSIAATRIENNWSALAIIRDITERKRIDDAVRKSEEKYRDLVESTSDLVWEVDGSGHYTYVSPVAEPLLGYEPKDLLGKTPFDIMAPAEAQRVSAVFAPIAASRRSFSLIENTIQRKDGQQVVLETSAVPIFDKDGGFCGYRGIDRNVTEHKVAEKALQRRDALMHAASTIASNLVTASSLDDAIRQALELISEVVRVDRIVVLEKSPTQTKPTPRYTWEGPRIAVKIDDGRSENSADETPEIVAWNAPVTRGKIVTGDVRTALGDVKAWLERLGIKRRLMVPIMVDGKYWGQIAFDSCDQQRDWADYEVESLQTIAELFGTAIQRDRYLKELADANRIVQNTPTILYRMRGEPTLPMIYISQNIKLFGHDPAALTASPLLYRSLIHPDDLPAVQEAMAHALVGETGVGEFRLLTSHGEFRWVENHYMPLLDGAGRLVEVEGLLSDITERKSAEDKIARLARTDSLTGLANRSTFTERLRESFAVSRRGARPFAVLYLDIDRFKDVNDTLGHPIGDRLLITIGERMQRCVRETDILARIGGDEFAVLQSDLSDTADAGTLADKLRAAIAETIQIGGNELHMTASIGIAVYEADIAVPEDLLAQADVALYRAKEEGRDQYRFHTQELDTQVREQVSIAEELRRAVGRGELELYYQPQVELSTSHITGMEALIRWRHPKRGLLLPGQFIEVAERTGTITSIGQWVLDSACRQMSVWRAAGVAPSTIAVNVSAVQLKAANEFVELVSATLKKWDLAAGELELDVTESTLARVALAQNDVLERLQKMGVRIAIDDFGMEYSSLDYLKTYHVNRIKIPRPLLDAALRDRDSAAVVRAIVDIARELGIEIVAGGVETEAEWSFLAAKSPVQKVQGFYYSKPVPADDATALLRGKRIEPGAPAVSSPSVAK